MSEIDQLFKNSETDKEIAISEQLWNRLEQRLDRTPKPVFSLKRYLIGLAASVLLTVTAVLLLRQGDEYILEDLDSRSHTTVNSETISQLHDLPVIHYNGGFLKG